ncbi:MAG: glycosyltransferase [Chitinophagales bacterium]|nr:glycosyltransferase [Chitinophagales bacterium]
MLPKISIVTPNYNGAKYLEACILSVINQNYTNLEYIIIDGGSTDNSVDIIKKHEKHITYWISEKDKGVFDAMNKGINISSGGFLYFLGSDDILCPNILNTINQYLDKENTSIVYGKVVQNNIMYGKEFKLNNLTQAEKLNPFIHQYIHHQAAFIHKQCFQILGLYDIQYKIGADVFFFLQALGNNEIKKTFIDIQICIMGNEGLSTKFEEMKLRDNFPQLVKKYLNIDINKKLYYREQAKYYLNDILKKKYLKGMFGLTTYIYRSREFLFYLKNLFYYTKKSFSK